MSKVPFLDLKRGWSEEINESIAATAASGIFLFGPRLKEFEKKFARHLGIDGGRVRGCHSGTDALILSLLAAGVEKEDEVITVVNSAVPTAAAIVSVGAKPIFADVDASSWLLSIQSCLARMSPRTKAIIPVHLYGNIFNVLALRAALDQAGYHEVKIIEDVAQAQGASFAGSAAGTMGDFGAFSFFPTKNLGAFGDGGAVVSSHLEGSARVGALAFYGQPERNLVNLRGGINSRLDEIQSTVLGIKIENLDRELSHKAQLLAQYRQELSGLALEWPKNPKEAMPAWHLAVVAVENKKIREELRSFLDAKGIDSMIHYPVPLNRQPAFHVEGAAPCPIGESLCDRVISLPFSAHHTPIEIGLVCSAISSFYHKKNKPLPASAPPRAPSLSP